MYDTIKAIIAVVGLGILFYFMYNASKLGAKDKKHNAGDSKSKKTTTTAGKSSSKTGFIKK